MLLLMVARGGWVNTIHGNLEFLDDEKANGSRRSRNLRELASHGQDKDVRRDSGRCSAYGFGSLDSGGAIYTVVNQRNLCRKLRCRYFRRHRNGCKATMIFHDAGFLP